MVTDIMECSWISSTKLAWVMIGVNTQNLLILIDERVRIPYLRY